jgi:hypothetical protein
MDDIQLNFFDLNVPCPENIINCENLRAQYKAEWEAVKSRGGCGGCMERSLRNKYITLVNSLLKK